MKMIIRGFALAIIGFVISLVYINYTIVDFHETQLIYATQNAMFATQEAEKNYILNKEYTDNPEKSFETAEAYFEDFKTNFLKQITSKNTSFEFILLDADIEKGLLNIEIIEHYYNVLGQEKTSSIQKTSLVNILGHDNPYKIKLLSNNDSYVGYYADVDDNGTIDGVIFFDYAQGVDTTEGDTFLYVDSSFTQPSVVIESKKSNLASYTFKTVEGHDNVVVKVSNEGDNRFYVIALQDVKSADGSIAPFYYEQSVYIPVISDWNIVTSTAFATGKINTTTMKAKWDAATYGTKNNRDMFTIDMNDWFVLSKDEWLVLGFNLKQIATGTYSSMTFPSGASLGFDQFCWASSLYSSKEAYFARFSATRLGFSNNNSSTIHVRLATTY